jgi:hypothetical protein
MDEFVRTAEFHKQWPDEFENGFLLAMGAIIGWCGGKGEEPPYLTEVLHQAYRHAMAEAFDAGARAYRDNHQS